MRITGENFPEQVTGGAKAGSRLVLCACIGWAFPLLQSAATCGSEQGNVLGCGLGQGDSLCLGIGTYSGGFSCFFMTSVLKMLQSCCPDLRNLGDQGSPLPCGLRETLSLRFLPSLSPHVSLLLLFLPGQSLGQCAKGSDREEQRPQHRFTFTPL